MAAIITKDTRLLNAKAFVESVSESENTVYYVFLGKPTTWPVEYAPPQAIDNYATQRDVWNNMEALKLVTTNDVIHAIPRYDWKVGNVYTAFNDRVSSANLFDSNYVVMNSEYNVYKCLGNGRGNVTTTEPTGTGASLTGAHPGVIVNNLDGYVWKFMYNIPVGTWVKFGTTSFIPCLNVTSQVQQVASNCRGIYDYTILNANVGSNSLGTLTYYAKIVGTGDGTANARVRITNGNVANVWVDVFGNNYTYANVIALINPSTGVESSLGNVVIAPVISPPGGHGYDGIDELGGIYAMINVRFEQTDAPIIPVTNFKFRQIGVLKDPFLYGTTKVPTLTTANTLLRAYSNVTIDGVISNAYKLISGATVRGTTSGANATVVGYNGNVINYVQSEQTSANSQANFTPFVVNDQLYVDTVSVGTIHELGNAAVDPYSGEIIYIDNRNVITRATDQVEDIFVVIEF